MFSAAAFSFLETIPAGMSTMRSARSTKKQSWQDTNAAVSSPDESTRETSSEVLLHPLQGCALTQCSPKTGGKKTRLREGTSKERFPSSSRLWRGPPSAGILYLW